MLEKGFTVTSCGRREVYGNIFKWNGVTAKLIEILLFSSQLLL